MMPNKYTADARIYADTGSILKPLLRGLAIQTDPSQELSLMVKTLLARPNLEKIARETDADVRATTPEAYEGILKDLKDNITIRSTGRENLYTISYTGTDPVYTRDVVQTSINVFVDSALGEKRQDTDQANEFLSRQISEYEARLVEAESKLASFKRENTGFLPGSDRSYVARLQQNRTQLEQTELALKETQTKVSLVKAQIAEEEALAANQVISVETEYDERLQNLEDRLDNLRFRYTDKHPDVIETRRQLGELRYLRDRELRSAEHSKTLLDDNEVYQNLKITLSELESEVGSLETRIASYQARISELSENIDQVPDIEARLTNLNRDYNITKAKYEQLLSRRESALISQSVGTGGADDIKFRVIEAPRVPNEPSGPFRMALLAVVLLGGIATGLFISFIVSQIAPVVSSSRQLYQVTGIPVFGMVSATPNSNLEHWAKRKKRLFIFANTLLVAVFSVMVMLNASTDIHDRVIAELSKRLAAL